MKKITILILMVFGFFTNANAFDGVKGFNLGVSLSAGLFEADGAKEEFKGAHVGGASPGNVSKSSADNGDGAKGAFGIGSIFAEAQITDMFAVGVDYVPHTLGTDTAENQQTDKTSSDTSTNRSNTVQVDFEDMTTVYATMAFPNVDGLYVKAGYMEVDVITNEKLGTGGSYANTSLDGYMVGLGFNHDKGDGMFVRVEASYMDLDGATLTNGDDSTKSITADGVTGYGAKLSVGRSF
tara:strand:- start:701 stop:1414 length:714 start_codon:yes stop_codon:yes gene_type:complete